MVEPQLIAVSGPLQGRSYSLRGATFTIGRQAEQDLQLLDLAVSRCHCELVRGGEAAWTLRDLESRYGTFVNGQPVHERALEHGDRVQVAGSLFVFLLPAQLTPRAPREAGDGPAAAALLDDSQLMLRSTVERRPELGEDNPFLAQPQRQADAIDAAGAAEERGALLQFCAAAAAAQDVAALGKASLELLLARLPIDRGCLLVTAPGASERPVPDELRMIAARAPAAASRAAERPVSRAVLTRVLAGPVALLCGDVSADPTLAGAPSLDGGGEETPRVRSFLCAPLVSRGRVLGALYAEAARPHALATAHLDLAVTAAAIAALALDHLNHLEWLRAENRRLRGGAASATSMVGESPAMKRLHALIQRVGPTSSTVLIRGESGTGKELCAQAIHAASPRADGPFLAINCASLSDALLESELFGHEKGAFTGAVARKIGKVEAAHGGTLFLDELGELPLALQARLLRVLQEREIDRVGGTKPIAVDVRVVAATNRDLESAMRAGKFREDLYYRLNVVTLNLPALRERREDIPLLARHFARATSERVGRGVVGIAEDARQALVRYDWPGNVRQLGNVIERALVLGVDELIRLEDLPDEVLAARATPSQDEAAPEAGTFHDIILATKRKLIVDAYEQARDDHQRAAALLGIHANSLHRLIRNLGLKSELGKDRD